MIIYNLLIFNNGWQFKIKTSNIYCTIVHNGNIYYHEDAAGFMFHRVNGPAIVAYGGKRSWFLHGINYSQEDHAKLIRAGNY